MAKNVGNIILIVIASLAIASLIRVIYVAVKCNTWANGNGIAMKVLLSGDCNTTTTGGKKKCKQKKRRNKKY